MPFEATVIKVMIASPGDVEKEREMSRDVIHEWNDVHGEDRRTLLLPVAWETSASPAMGERAQGIVNKQLLQNADLLIAVFWTRIGTSTGVAESGTVEEIEEHLKAGKPAMLYFSTAPIRPDSVDEVQYRALREFKASIQLQGLVEEYDSLDAFREKLSRQLAKTVITHFPADRLSAATSGEAPLRARGAQLSDKARDLLNQAIQDRHGAVLVTLTMSGLSVDTNEHNMLRDPRNPREQARWRAVVKELVEAGYLNQRDLKGEVFEVTDQGYKAGGLLS